MKPIIGQLTEAAGKPWTLKGFDLVVIPEEKLGIQLPPRNDYGGLDNLIRIGSELNGEQHTPAKEAFRKQVLLEVIQLIAKL